MKKLLIPFVLLAVIMAMGSCSGSKKVAYFQNIDSISLAASRGLYDAKIMPKDELTITVLTTNPEASAPFNLTVSNTVGTSGQLSTSVGSLQGYLVDNNGDINFPVLGKLHVGGLTKTQTEDMILSKVRPYLNAKENPIVTVRMSSYRVTVIGEVGAPKVVPVTTEKMSIIEALAYSGDLTIYGKRGNVLLIREDANGEKKAHRLNLNDGNLFNSPYYYLQQNDIIYVEPNSVKAKNSAIGSSTTIWFSFIGIVTSVASLLVNILRK
ncbi:MULTISPECIES: polysaccharide biosynthesis/export family protein [Prevotellaceae]|uniref:BexD/CtrA/VexA family polysaccharide export protein n=2 Tax=Prevotellaceae TaxID=171552 RepID=F9D6L8_PREDD|nr:MULTISPECIES: polysaccharide biosynthesis/export family protein [Prevotellaceae]AGB29592.1 periplasmic protein involved in polysaccharide export [Prevotella dentalis DSM 3688]EGQ11935.1 BexD/CtrA/VexA family polysaccharide export protein [Prevotella dentalis DSM 3688]